MHFGEVLAQTLLGGQARQMNVLEHHELIHNQSQAHAAYQLMSNLCVERHIMPCHGLALGMIGIREQHIYATVLNSDILRLRLLP